MGVRFETDVLDCGGEFDEFAGTFPAEDKHYHFCHEGTPADDQQMELNRLFRIST